MRALHPLLLLSSLLWSCASSPGAPPLSAEPANAPVATPAPPSPGVDETPRRQSAPSAYSLSQAVHGCTDDSGHQVRRIDLNGDGAADVVEVLRDGALLCRRVDLDFDGRHEMIRFYDDQGQPTREGMDLDFDGQIDVVSTDDQAVTGLDTDGNGRPDAWVIRSNGRVIERRRDRDGDGRVDQWEELDDSGATRSLRYDDDGDGAPD